MQVKWGTNFSTLLLQQWAKASGSYEFIFLYCSR